MTKTMLTALRMFVMLTLITGVLYPLGITLLAQALFPVQANGSLLVAANHVIGSALIGQANQEARYFWPRPSAVSYMDRATTDALGSSGATNLGPTSALLADQVQARAAAFRTANQLAEDAAIPADMLLASGSGLDPHISPAAARIQIARVAAARGVDAADVAALVEQHVEGPQLGLLGAPRVDVLKLNLALDGIQ
jgi:K+-transporting ATPase ATPase C chain